MGYSFYLISKDKKITLEDYQTALSNLSEFNREGLAGRMPCDLEYSKNYIRISGSFGISGKYAEGFVLNLLMCFMDLGYNLRVLSRDWNYGTKEDWEWLESSHKTKTP